MRGLCTSTAGSSYSIVGRTPSSLVTPVCHLQAWLWQPLCLFAKVGIAVAGSNVSLLLLTLQSCTDEWEQVPEFLGLC